MADETRKKHPDLRRIGARLRRIRNAKGLTCLDVEKATGILFSSVAQIERGEVNFSVLTLQTLAALYGVEWSALQRDDEPVLALPVMPRPRQVYKIKRHIDKATAEMNALLAGLETPDEPDHAPPAD